MTRSSADEFQRAIGQGAGETVRALCFAWGCLTLRLQLEEEEEEEGEVSVHTLHGSGRAGRAHVDAP